MTVPLRVISNPVDLFRIKDEWDAFIREHCNNPFFLYTFVSKFMDLDFRSQSPLILFALENNKIIGIALFCVKKVFNLLRVTFLFQPHFSPDFIIDDMYKEKFLKSVVKFLSSNLKCQFIDLTLPSESSNVDVLEKICRNDMIYFRKCLTYELGHCVLPIKGSWDEFEKLRGGNFRRRFRRIESKMEKEGGYEVLSVEKYNHSLLEEIDYIERRSWKEKWRKKKRAKCDPELIKLIEAVKDVDNENLARFKWKVWFLKIKNELASYALIFKFKDYGFIAKTSYNEKYRNFYPGIYVINTAIKDFFENLRVEKIDFQTNLSFMKTWNPLVFPKVRFMMGQRSIFSFLISLLASESFRKFKDSMLS